MARISGIDTTSPTIIGNIKTPVETTLTANEPFEKNGEKKYYIVIWISETGLGQTDIGNFNGVVRVSTSQPPTASSATLYNLNLVPNTNIPNFNNNATTDEGIFISDDDLGTSYYFRGAAENNYVYFAEKYWRIMRINGDGSIRVIYDGTSPHVNGESNVDRHVSSSSFWPSRYDISFGGYMNGTVDETLFQNGTSNSISYAENIANLTNSNIKTFLEGTDSIDGWYKTNIVDKEYSEYVVDAIYCNNRKLDENHPEYTGIGTTQTYYLTFQRLVNNDVLTPSLKCEQKSDRFTQTEKINNVEGNKKLKYPIGIISIDEAVFAGGNSSANTSYYLYTGSWIWTMSPAGYANNGAGIFTISDKGIAISYKFSNVTYGTIKPVISISPDAIQYGNGTITNPFRLSA